MNSKSDSRTRVEREKGGYISIDLTQTMVQVSLASDLLETALAYKGVSFN